MELIRAYGKEDLAMLYVLRIRDMLSMSDLPSISDRGNGLIECVESLQPPIPRSEKWVLIVSTLLGCPVGCQMCDAGGWYRGRLTADEILAQVRFMVKERFGGTAVPSRKFKIQFARMGEPALNPAVLEVLERLPVEFDAPGLLPSLSSVGPKGSEPFFEELLRIKDRLYGNGAFQLQFSIHTTDPEARRSLIPINALDFAWLGKYGSAFRKAGDQQITLNFAAAKGLPVDPVVLSTWFDPQDFLIKITPLNPTLQAKGTHLVSAIDPCRPATAERLVRSFEEAGYRVILSIGEVEENAIGSNCGQYVTSIKEGDIRIKDGYTADRYVL